MLNLSYVSRETGIWRKSTTQPASLLKAQVLQKEMIRFHKLGASFVLCRLVIALLVKLT